MTRLAPALQLAVSMTALLLAACGSTGHRPVLERDTGPPSAWSPPAAPATPSTSTPRPGGYYKDDGPGDNPPDAERLAAVPEPEPRTEPLHRFANNPYNVFGIDYVPMRSLAPFRQRGLGSWYGRKFHGQRTSSGEPYDMYGMTAAHPTLPIPSYALVINTGNGRSVIVRINDRGPFHPGRVIDLSYTAAWKLGYVAAGSTPVEVELLMPDRFPAIIAARRAAGGTNVAQANSAKSATAGNARTSGTGQASSRTATAAGPGSPGRAESAPAAQPARVTALTESPPPSGTPIAAAEPARAAPIPVDVEPGGVFLQLGAFSGRENAESFRARIYRDLSWLSDAIQILPRDGLFRLHLGPYRDRSEATGMADRIRAALELKPVIVVR